MTAPEAADRTGTHADQAPSPVVPTRERILDASEQLFAERGFAGTAMRDIARAVDLTPASLYSHFPSKQALYEAVLEQRLRPLFRLLDTLAESEWTSEQLDHGMEILLGHLTARPQVLRLVLHEALTGGEHLTQTARDWLKPLYARALEAFSGSGRSTLRPEWTADDLPLLIAALHYLVLGHFAMAPLLREVFGEDPLTPGASERHAAFLARLLRLVIFAPDGEGP